MGANLEPHSRKTTDTKSKKSFGRTPEVFFEVHHSVWPQSSGFSDLIIESTIIFSEISKGEMLHDCWIPSLKEGRKFNILLNGFQVSEEVIDLQKCNWPFFSTNGEIFPNLYKKKVINKIWERVCSWQICYAMRIKPPTFSDITTAKSVWLIHKITLRGHLSYPRRGWRGLIYVFKKIDVRRWNQLWERSWRYSIMKIKISHWWCGSFHFRTILK